MIHKRYRIRVQASDSLAQIARHRCPRWSLLPVKRATAELNPAGGSTMPKLWVADDRRGRGMRVESVGGEGGRQRPRRVVRISLCSTRGEINSANKWPGAIYRGGSASLSGSRLSHTYTHVHKYVFTCTHVCFAAFWAWLSIGKRPINLGALESSRGVIPPSSPVLRAHVRVYVCVYVRILSVPLQKPRLPSHHSPAGYQRVLRGAKERGKRAGMGVSRIQLCPVLMRGAGISVLASWGPGLSRHQCPS